MATPSYDGGWEMSYFKCPWEQLKARASKTGGNRYLGRKIIVSNTETKADIENKARGYHQFIDKG